MAIGEYKFVRDAVPEDSQTKAMAHRRAKDLGATDEELA